MKILLRLIYWINWIKTLWWRTFDKTIILMNENEYQQLLRDFYYMAITYEDTQRLKKEVNRRMKKRYYDLKFLESELLTFNLLKQLKSKVK